MPDDHHDDDIRTDIKWIRKKLESQCDWQKNYEKETDAKIEAVKGRVGTLETWRSFLTGGFAVLTVLVMWGIIKF